MTTMRLEMKPRGFHGVIDTLNSLPPEIVSKRGGPVKAALRKGALVILREAKLNLAHRTGGLSPDGAYESTGLLQKNLIASRGKAPISGKGERYLVRVKRAMYPTASAEIVTTLKSANLLEYGSSTQPAEPWLRPAFATKAQQAIETTERELIKGIDRVVKKLSQQNKGR